MNILLAGSWGDAQAQDWLAALTEAVADGVDRGAGADGTESGPTGAGNGRAAASSGHGATEVVGGAGRQSPQPWRWFTRRGDCPDEQLDVAVVANPAPGALRGLTGLRLIQSLWAGVDRLLDDPDLPPGVPVARMVDPAMNAAMAQTALWATLSLHRGFYTYARQQVAAAWQPLAQTRADECPVLVLGLGEMGRAAARLLRAAGYPVTVWRRRPEATDLPGVAIVHGPLVPAATPGSAAHQALGQCRVLINLLPLTPATRGLINAALLSAMREDAAVVNLARGAHVVEADLLDWLDRRSAAHAVLDVFQTEPLPAEHRFWHHPRVTVLPHAAAQTDARSAAAVAADNLWRLARGQPLRHRVDRRAGY